MHSALFPAVTMALSGLVFATVWTMTDPAGVPAAPAPAPAPVSAIAVADTPAGDRDGAPVVIRRARPVTVRHAPRAAVRRTHRAARMAAAVPSTVYYAGCREVRAAGAAPLYRGQPGYRTGIDGDGDGIACEPHRRG